MDEERRKQKAEINVHRLLHSPVNRIIVPGGEWWCWCWWSPASIHVRVIKHTWVAYQNISSFISCRNNQFNWWRCFATRPKAHFRIQSRFLWINQFNFNQITNCHLYSSLFRVRLFHSIVSSIFHLSLQLPLMCVPNLSASKFILHTKDMLK